jgi:phenylalanyl-tRNA synthetase beta chain
MEMEVYCAEVNFSALFELTMPEPTFTPLPKYPAVTRDLALLCDEAQTVASIEKCIESAAGKLLRSVTLFDIYRGKGVPEGKKSMAFSLELRADDRTLTDEDSVGVVNKVLAKLEAELGIQMR